MKKRTSSARAGLMAGGAIMALATGGYGHRAQAQAAGCGAPDAGGLVSCSGAITTEQQFGRLGDPPFANLNITTTSDFSLDTSGTPYADGFDLFSRSLNVTVTGGGDITGAASGVRATTYNGLQLTTEGAVNGIAGYGVLDRGYGVGANVEVGSVTAGGTGIYLAQRGSGAGAVATVIDVTGDVTAGGRGVRAYNNFSDAALTTRVGGSVNAGSDGVAIDAGGSAIIDVTGDVAATQGTGVRATGNGGYVYFGFPDYFGFSVPAVDIDIGGSVTAGATGIDASTSSTGGVYINVVGDVTSTGAVAADAASDGPQATISGYDGVRVRHTATENSRRVLITVDGTITANAGNGVYLARDDDYYNSYISAGAIDAAMNGVAVNTGDNASTRISVGDVTAGGVAFQLNASGHSANRNDITITGDVTSMSGTDIYDENGSTRVTLGGYDDSEMFDRETGRTLLPGSLSGMTLLGSDADSFTIRSGTLGPDAVIDGGEGSYDRFSFQGSATVEGTQIQNFEVISVGEGIGWFVRLPENEGEEFQAPDPMTAQFGADDTLTPEGEFGSVRVGVNSILSSGDTLTINSARGVSLNGPQAVYGKERIMDRPPMMTRENERPELIGEIPGGVLFTGGTPGASTINVVSTAMGGGVTGSGTIDMSNGAVGDAVNVTGEVFLLAPRNGDVLRVDIDPAVAEGDLLTASGNITLAGNIDVNVINITETGTTDHVVARSSGGVVRSGDDLITTAPETAGGPQADVAMEGAYALTASTESVAAEVEARIEGQEVIVQVTTDFTPEVDPPADDPDALEDDPVDEDVAELLETLGLTRNGTAVGEYLNEVLNDPALADVRALALGATSIAELEALYESLGGVEMHAPLYSSFQGGAGFGSGLFSCQVGEGQFAAIDEGQCGWTRISGAYLDRDGRAGDPGVDESRFQIAFGGQMELDENIRLGGGVGYTSVDSDGDAGLDFNGDRLHAGVVAKYVDGPFMAGVSLTGGITFGDTDRAVGGQVAEGSFNTVDFSAIARVAYLAEVTEEIYVKPQLEGGVTYVDREGFTETGAGAANLQVASEDRTFAHFSPSVEIGGDFAMEDGVKIRPYLRVGATFVSEDTVNTTARFAASTSAATFTTSSVRDDIYGTVNAGVAIFSDEDLSIRAEYQGAFSDDTEAHGGFVKVQINF